jgi:phosphate/sulfate permease
MLGEISVAWMATPIVAILISFISLFILQNVFQQKTYIPVEYQMTAEAEQRIRAAGIRTDHLTDLQEKTYPNASQFQKALSQRVILNAREMSVVMSATDSRGESDQQPFDHGRSEDSCPGTCRQDLYPPLAVGNGVGREVSGVETEAGRQRAQR